MSQEKTQGWLKIASAVVIGFGIAMAASALPAVSSSTGLLLDLIFWPIDGGQTAEASEVHLLSAICGGILTGWGLLLWQLATRLYPRDPELARSLILSSIVTWFMVDGIASAMAGAPLNAALNIGFLLLFIVPLWRPAEAAHS